MVRSDDWPGPIEFGMARGIKDSPVRSDATFENLPGLVDRFNDIVVNAVGLCSCNEIAQNDRLINASRIGILEVVPGARPSKFRNDDSFSGVGFAQFVVDQHGLVDRLIFGKPFPIGENVCGNVIDRGHQFGMLDPHVPDFAGRNRHVGGAFHALDHLDEIADLLLAAENRFVPDNDAIDVAVAFRELDHRAYLALIAILVLVDPRSCGDAQAELRGDAGHEFDAAGRRIRADRARQRGKQFEIGTDLSGLGHSSGVRMR